MKPFFNKPWKTWQAPKKCFPWPAVALPTRAIQLQCQSAEHHYWACCTCDELAFLPTWKVLTFLESMSRNPHIQTRTVEMCDFAPGVITSHDIWDQKRVRLETLPFNGLESKKESFRKIPHPPQICCMDFCWNFVKKNRGASADAAIRWHWGAWSHRAGAPHLPWSTGGRPGVETSEKNSEPFGEVD